jgi:hypothetical protein
MSFAISTKAPGFSFRILSYNRQPRGADVRAYTGETYTASRALLQESSTHGNCALILYLLF